MASSTKRRKVAEKKPAEKVELTEEEALERIEELFGEETPFTQKGDWCYQTAIETLPLIKIDNAFLLSYPCDELVCRRLIEHCTQAPYGRGSDTILDEGVRKTWHMDPEKVNIMSKQWVDMFNDSKTSPFLETIRTQLTPKCPKISAKLYKLLVYEPGSFFVAHRDTQREKHHFGTIVLFFPTEFTAGELHVRHDGQDRAFSFSYSSGELTTDVLKCHAVSFFADCEHEVSHVQSGYRVALTYNLFFEGPTTPQVPSAMSDEVVQLHDYLRQLFTKPDWAKGKKKIGLFLQHQYALASISGEYLKGVDKTFYDALMSAGDEYTVEVVPIEVKAEGQAGDDEACEPPKVYYKECVKEQYMIQFEVHRLVPGAAPKKAPAKKAAAASSAAGAAAGTLKQGELLARIEWEGSPSPSGGPVHFVSDLTKIDLPKQALKQSKSPTGNEGTEFVLQYQLAAILVSLSGKSGKN